MRRNDATITIARTVYKAKSKQEPFEQQQQHISSSMKSTKASGRYCGCWEESSIRGQKGEVLVDDVDISMIQMEGKLFRNIAMETTVEFIWENLIADDIQAGTPERGASS